MASLVVDSEGRLIATGDGLLTDESVAGCCCGPPCYVRAQLCNICEDPTNRKEIPQYIYFDCPAPGTIPSDPNYTAFVGVCFDFNGFACPGGRACYFYKPNDPSFIFDAVPDVGLYNPYQSSPAKGCNCCGEPPPVFDHYQRFTDPCPCKTPPFNLPPVPGPWRWCTGPDGDEPLVVPPGTTAYEVNGFCWQGITDCISIPRGETPAGDEAGGVGFIDDPNPCVQPNCCPNPCDGHCTAEHNAYCDESCPDTISMTVGWTPNPNNFGSPPCPTMFQEWTFILHRVSGCQWEWNPAQQPTGGGDVCPDESITGARVYCTPTGWYAEANVRYLAFFGQDCLDAFPGQPELCCGECQGSLPACTVKFTKLAAGECRCPESGGWTEIDAQPCHTGTATITFGAAAGASKGSRGFGDTIARFTKAIGLRECAGCARRRAALNQLFPYGSR